MILLDLITGVGCMFIAFLAADKASSEAHRWWERRQFNKIIKRKLMK